MVYYPLLYNTHVLIPGDPGFTLLFLITNSSWTGLTGTSSSNEMKRNNQIS